MFKQSKVNIWLGLFIFMMLSMAGCENPVEEHVYEDLTVDNFYSTNEEAQLALNGVYAEIWGTDIYRDGQWTTLSDVTGGVLRGGGDPNGSGDRSGANTPWNSFSWTQDAREVGSAWNTNYGGINNANTLIAKLEENDISEKDRIIGEAKFMRALFYFNLVRIFGPVPLEIEATLDAQNLEKPRSSTEEVYNQIISDLQDAESLLSPHSEQNHAAGRATAGAAKALLSKVYLQRRDWSNAESKAKELMDMGVFGLEEDFRDILNPQNQNNEEEIFSVQKGGPANEDASIFWTRRIFLFGPPAHTLPDGTSIRFHNLQDVVIFQVYQDFFNSTPDTYRKWQTMRDEMPYYFEGNNLVEETVDLYAPFVVKNHYVNFDNAELHKGINTPLIRYSDVLLTYAEAVNEANGGPTQEAYDAINQVRQRARGVGTSEEQPESVYPDLAGLNQAQFRDSVLAERAREFVGEGHRRWDLLRHDRLISNAQQRGVSSAAEHHVLFPLPGSALEVNEELEQNSGY